MMDENMLEPEHFQAPDDGRFAHLVRGAIWVGWDRHLYRLVAHRDCGHHMERIGACDGACYDGYGYPPSDPSRKTVPRPGCAEMRCISERAAVGGSWWLAREKDLPVALLKLLCYKV